MSFGNGFLYRKLHYIQGTSSGAQTDYQVMFKVYDGVGTDSGQSVYLNGKARPELPDIRFTTLNGSPCYHWIEHTPQQTGYHNVWVKIPSIPIGGCAVYLLYGNANCVDGSNGDLTFAFFDDFLGSAVNTAKWTVSVGSPTVSGSTLTIAAGRMFGTSNFGFGYASRSYCKRANQDGVIGFNDWNYHAWDSRVSTYYALNCGKDSSHETQSNTALSGDTNYRICEVFPISSSLVTLTVDGTYSVSQTNSAYIYTGSLTPIIQSTTNTFYVDWHVVRKYAATEPAHGAWLAEECSTSPVLKAYDVRGDPR